MYIAGILLVMDLVFLRDGDNSGGHIAHLGGALYGFLAARGLDRGRDWSMSFTNGLERISDFVTRRKKGRMRVVTPVRRRVMVDADQGAPRTDKQARVDAILDKISRSGYDSLSKEERDFLFKASKDK
jgi:hypothetical protein